MNELANLFYISFMNLQDMNIGQFEHRLLLAFALGTIIGLERQWRHKLAGVKTNALVSGGAALFILASENIGGDPSGAARIAANIVTGIGFLGAGIMMRDGVNISGINTAATIWCSAAIGTLAGLGHFYEGIVGTAFVVFGNIVLRPIGNKIDHRIQQIEVAGYSYALHMHCTEQAKDALRVALIESVKASPTLHLSSISIESNNKITAEIHSLDRRQTDIESIIAELSLIKDVQAMKWEEIKK
jgi:putative Mg2+ transporter-C (MgtC) family protein